MADHMYQQEVAGEPGIEAEAVEPEVALGDEALTVDGDPVAEQAVEDAPAEKPAYDYEAERAKKLAFRASLTDEDIARMRKHGRPTNYRFGQKIAEGIENVQESGDEEERKRSAEDIERDARIEAAARVDDWQTKLDGMSFDERVSATIECLGRRQSYARVLRAVMEYCVEQRLSEDVEAFVETLPDFSANRQSARRYIFFLMRTGALEEVGYDADGNVVDERTVAAVQEQLTPKPDVEDEDAEGEGETVEVPEQVDEAGQDTAEAQPEEEQPDEGQPEDAPAEGAEAIVAEEVADAELVDTDKQPAQEQAPVDPEDLIVEWRIQTTDAGKAALEQTDAHGRLTTLLDGQPEDRYSAYLDLLTFCEEPRTLAQISEFLIGNPGLEIDDRGIIHMQPNAYIGKLDTAGALTWTGEGWQTTPEAHEVLGTL